MAACMIRNVLVPPQSFLHLLTLDLAFNRLSNEAILELGKLPALQYLDLSYNDIVELPFSLPGMHLSMKGEVSDHLPNFPCLQTLILDDNHLTPLSSFPALAGLPSLRHLSLARNKIDFVPHLVPSKAGENPSDSNQPFRSLQVLSLVANSIAVTEDVIEVGSWPSVAELHLWGNPLTCSRTKLPAALNKALCEDRGITVVRLKPLPPSRPPPLVPAANLVQVCCVHVDILSCNENGVVKAILKIYHNTPDRWTRHCLLWLRFPRLWLPTMHATWSTAHSDLAPRLCCPPCSIRHLPSKTWKLSSTLTPINLRVPVSS
jgi:hypothetical protein